MTAQDLYDYLDDLRDSQDLKRIPVLISEKQGLFAGRTLSSSVLVCPRGIQPSLVLCPEPLSKRGKEDFSVFGEYDDKKD